MNENVSNIIFADYEKTSIKIFYKDGRIEVKSYNPDDDVVKEVLGQTTEFDVEVNTYEFAKKEAAARKKFEDYILKRNDVKIEIREVPVERTVEKSLKEVVHSILENKYSKEELFDLKVEILELLEITDKSIKTKIRKSKDVLEILALIHQSKTAS